MKNQSDQNAPDDTIAAIASGAGKAGIGIVRVSGSMAPAIAHAITNQRLKARHAHHLPFYDADGQTLDEGIAIFYEAPHSFTGEHVLELQGHGGAVVLDLLLSRVIDLGARHANPGEFSERAFYNDKMDLAQAEAVSDLIQSSSAAAARAAARSMSGEFSAAVNQINDDLIALRVWLEAALDFSEEDIDFLADERLQQRASDLLSAFESLLAKAEQGQRLRDGLSIVIAGVTNAGKSSLLNALTGQDTAIVTAIAGTTRDVLKSDVVIEGLPIHIVDTAGVRQTSDAVEKIGIERARQAVTEADHVLVLVDATNPVLPEGLSLSSLPGSLIINKIDAVSDENWQSLAQSLGADLSVSVKRGDGMAELRSHLLSLAGYDSAIEGVYSARRRHVSALNEAQSAMLSALERLQNHDYPELAAEELRQAQQSLETIVGRFGSEDLLGQIFSSFCIGK
ncbi:MAG: tRNA uridine-5-carboxymethylaminomethyl(34) synthesis GTPase MnmE [Granulosicoccus sp.]|nr:tRNA uridine-5-carboxymethylaminomethyl(34) synthesis GTPase MnmE [Granulosicoccus sp.]